jgi:hypothetical protein
MHLHDLIYFDFEKASSIWSQFQWGKTEQISVSEDSSTGASASLSIGVPNAIGGNLGAERGEKRTVLETRILHHDLLNRIESLLSANGLVVDLSQVVPPNEDSPEVVRKAIGTIPYIKAQGWCVIEDYRRILGITERLNGPWRDFHKGSTRSYKEELRVHATSVGDGRVVPASKGNQRS